MTPHTMRAIRVHRYGSPRELKLETVARPEPQAGEILVRVHAAGVLPMETAVRQGMFPGAMPKAFPYTPGTAFSGVVEALGEGVTAYNVGDALAGRAPSGSYAEYTTINTAPPPVTAKMERWRHSAAIIPLAPKPEAMTFDEAATLSGGATTAWTSIFDDGGVEAGQRVLIHGGAGGVGLFAVQFAKWKGAEVFATASGANVDYLRSIGADTVIDYRSTRFEDVVHDVDFVLDTIGGDTLQRSIGVLNRGGSLVSVVEVPDQAVAEMLGVRAINNATIPNSDHLRQIVQLIDAGHVITAIRQTFPLSEAYKAHELCETGHGRGRIVLHISD